MRSSSQYSDPALGWIQSSFTAQESGDYLEGPIQICWNTAAQGPVLGYFQMGISMADLQRTFLRHYLPKTAESWASSLSGSKSTSSLGACLTPTRVIPGFVSSPMPPDMPLIAVARL